MSSRSSTTRPDAKHSDSPWAPLRCRTFRALWLAMAAANAGMAMQVVGAQWLAAGAGANGRHAAADILVTLVQAAGMLPILVLGLPAGVLADLVDRRRLLIRVQLGTALVGLLLAALAMDGRIQSMTLLSLQCALGVGAAFTMPAFGSLTPELVERRHLPQASALGAISANVTRAAGPATAGFLIARAGASAVFALHAVTVIVFVVVLTVWRPERPSAPRCTEPFGAALGAGWRYVRSTPVVRRILGHALVFLLPGSALLALLPLLAANRLGLGVTGLGVLLGALGAGAVAGAIVQPRLRALPARDRMAAAAGVFLAALVIVAVSRDPVTVGVVLVAAGAAWVIALACTNSAIESYLPEHVRARGLAFYQVVLFGGQGLGAVGWGLCAHSLGLQWALLLAAAGLGVAALAGRGWPLHEHGHDAEQPSTAQPGPEQTGPEQTSSERPGPEAPSRPFALPSWRDLVRRRPARPARRPTTPRSDGRPLARPPARLAARPPARLEARQTRPATAGAAPVAMRAASVVSTLLGPARPPPGGPAR
ncbi:MFS transporter [Dactylosporangium sp. NPDC000555]|uniref:MFS transporter n=1 Tax=Dactylosporangium sp. NPDC000555 TaxID=3154260 RepID=UPI00331CBF8C